MTKVTDLSNIDFNGIKSQLIEFLKTQDEFKDYDFDGSGLSTLVDLLSHNTHMNALLAHVNMSETFLDSARVRSNVVSHAQAIGYTPRSHKSSKGILSVVIQGKDTSDPSLTIPKGHKFTGSINGEQYSFVTLRPYTAQKRGDYSYLFQDVHVHEGVLREELYRPDVKTVHQEIEINSSVVDLSTLRVYVYENPSTNIFEEYTFYQNIVELTKDDPIFYVRENSFGRYVVYFGDGYLGKIPQPGSVIKLEWLDTSGPVANNIKSLTSAGNISGESKITTILSLQEPLTFGGSDRESIESVRYNAPVSYSVQNRAVTASDYKILLMQKFPELKDISVWGGEDANPPVYGKVYIAPALYSRLKSGEVLKKSMTEFLRYRNIGSITTEIVDAEYTNIVMSVRYKFDAKNSNVNENSISSSIRQAILDYSDKELGRFDGVLRYSNLLTTIDRSHQFITGSTIYIDLMKSFTPDPLKVNDYSLEFPVPIYDSSATDTVSYSSTFVYEGINCRLLDEPDPQNERYRRLYLINANTRERLPGQTNKGFIDTPNGIVYIQNMKFDTSNPIQFFVRPNTYDIVPKYKQLLVLDESFLNIDGELDTVSVYNIKGLSTYSPFRRHLDV